MRKPRLYTLRMVLVAGALAAIAGSLLAASLVITLVERNQALDSARLNAELMIEKNLSIHRYFTEELKPSVFALAGQDLPERYFDARWMSSAFAVRTIQGYLSKFQDMGYYYKECAINARFPGNEADEFEKSFLERAGRDPKLTEWTGTRTIGGEPYLVLLRRGESMEESCLLCHSTPARAPKGLVASYGSQRSFGRTAGELVSVLSVRVPLAVAYASASDQSVKVALGVAAAMAAALFLLSLMLRAVIQVPLACLRAVVARIESDQTLLGMPIATGGVREVRELADSFSRMSARVKHHLDGLESQVAARTAHLEVARNRLVEEVDERRKAEAALSVSERRYRSLFSTMSEAFALYEVITDAEGKPEDYRFLDVNAAFAKDHGRAQEQIIGTTRSALMPGEDSLWLDACGRVALSGSPASFSYYSKILRKHYEIYAFRPEAMTVAVLSRDVTESKTLEESLRQSQKMEAIGRLAGGVAHDFNNMLAVILGHVELAHDHEDPAQLFHPHLNEIEKSANRSAELTRQLLAYASKQTVAPMVLDLNETVTGTLKMLQRLIGEDIQLTWHLAEALWPVKLDPFQIDQILANLCINARDAITEGGKITIETGNVRLDAAYCAAHADFTPGEYVLLAVGDNGCGMDKETQSHIFEPFFTTKSFGKGTGLGLATVYGIVKQNHGSIRVSSEPGQGTTFNIYLPRHADSAALTRSSSKADLLPDGDETILLVEDQQAVLDMTRQMLERQRYTVIAAGTPREAIRLASEHVGKIHLLLSDVVMPEMNGRDLARHLLAIHHGLKCVFMSGYTADVIAQHGILDEGTHFIQKPFTRKDLAAKIRAVLGTEG